MKTQGGEELDRVDYPCECGWHTLSIYTKKDGMFYEAVWDDMRDE